MDDQQTDREGSVRQPLNWFCCLLLIPIISNLSMWLVMVVAWKQLEHSDWFADNILARLLPIGFAAAVIGLAYTAYLALWRGRETAEVAACCLLSATALAVNILGVLVIMSRIPRL